MKKVIVTGGAGYIGSHTVIKLLKNQIEPIIIDNFSNSNPIILNQLKKIVGKNINLYNTDCRNFDEVNRILKKEKGVIGIIHFAAFKAVNESIQNPKKYYSNNMLSLENMLNIASIHEIKNFIFSSSCTVYGDTKVFPVNENEKIKKPTSPYGHTKQLGEMMLKEQIEKGNKLKGISLRYFNPVGAHPSGLIGELPLNIPNNLFPILSRMSMMKKTLKIYGNDYNTLDGTCERDFIHVEDLAQAHVNALIYLESLSNSTYENINIGTGKSTSILNIVKLFKQYIDHNFKFEFAKRRDGDIAKIYADTKKCFELLNWSPSKTILDSLNDQWRWQKTFSTL